MTRADIFKQIEKKANENGLLVYSRSLTPLKDEITYQFVNDDIISIKFNNVNELTEESIKEQIIEKVNNLVKQSHA